MPSHVAGRIAIVLGLAAILLFTVMTFVPPTMHVLAALISLPVGASLLAGATASPRRRVR